MDATLGKLGVHSDIKSVAGLVDAVHVAKEYLERKASLPTHEVRQKLLTVFEIVFAAGKPRLAFIAMEGLQGIIRDSSLYSDKDGCRNIDSLSSQMLKCLEAVSNWNSQIQCQIFTVIVQLISNNEFQISMTDVFTAIQICSKTYLCTEDPGVKLAVRAALTQMLNSFCLNRQLKATDSNSQEEVAVLMDITALLNEIFPRLHYNDQVTPIENINNNNIIADELQLASDALYSIISALPPFFYKHLPLLNLFKDEIIPALICLLQVSCDDEKLVAAADLESTKSKFIKQLTFRSNSAINNDGASDCNDIGIKTRPNIFVTPEVARSFYQVVEQILQLFAKRENEERQILELYRAALLVTPTTKRFEALKLIKRMVSNPARMSIYLQNLSTEPLYWLIPMQCIEECSKCPTLEICVEALNCLNALFSTLIEFVEKMDLSTFPSKFIEKLDEDFMEIRGTYQSIQLLKRKNSVAEQSKKQAALKFVRAFKTEHIKWLKETNEMKIDEMIQQFSIQMFKEQTTLTSTIINQTSVVNCEDDIISPQPNQQQQTSQIFDAMAIYFTVYASLDFCFRARFNEEYDDYEVIFSLFFMLIFFSKPKLLANGVWGWLSKILGVDSMNATNICVEREWLSDVYELISAEKFLCDFARDSTLEWMIDDYDGFANGVLMDIIRKKPRAERETIKRDFSESGKKFEKWLKNILASCWSSILCVLTKFSLKNSKKLATLSINTVTSASTTLLAPSEKILNDGARATLETMQSLLTLLIRFSMDKEMVWVYERMCEEICLLEDLRQLVIGGDAISVKKPWLLINRNDAFAIAVMIENAMQYAALPSGVWKYIVRCIEYASEVERVLYSTPKEKFQWHKNGTKPIINCNDYLNFSNNELSITEVGNVIDSVRLKIDNFFETASAYLNLPSMCALLEALISINEDNLKYSGLESSTFIRCTSCILLQRIAQLIHLSSGRTLIYLQKIWNYVKNHFVETAFVKFPDDVTKQSLCSIYDCLQALLKDEEQNEKWRFNFNCDLLSVFQNILCCDATKIETQEQIVGILGDILELNVEKIGSGWKPFFLCLKTIQITDLRTTTQKIIPRMMTDGEQSANALSLTYENIAVLEVFKKFLKVKHDRIIYSALLEFDHALINYLRSATITLLNSVNLDKIDDDLAVENFIEETISGVLFECIEKIQALLIRFYENADDLPTNNAYLNKIGLREKSIEWVDPHSYESKLKNIDDLSTILCGSSELGFFPSEFNELSNNHKSYEFPWQNLTDQQKCIYELLLSLIDDLCSLLSNSSQKIHSKLVMALTDLVATQNHKNSCHSSVQRKRSRSGFDFIESISVFSLCTQILPTIQKWVRSSPLGFHSTNQLEVRTRNLKQSMGTFTQVVVDYITEYPKNQWSEKLLTDTLHLLNEFISHSSQFISGVGCSCLKHLLISAGKYFGKQMWSLVALSLWKSTCLTLFPVRMLISQFFSDSTEFCGDMGQMSVIIDNKKKSSEEVDYRELQIMAKQVFQISMDKSNDLEKLHNTKTTHSHQFAYSFVFQRNDKTKAEINPLENLSIDLDELVISLLNQQMIIQIISLLLTGDNDALLMNGSFLKNHQLINKVDAAVEKKKTGIIFESGENNDDEPIDNAAIATLIYCLRASSIIAENFDQRPALKFLLQKLCHLDECSNETSVNLYKIYVACQTLQLLTLHQLTQRNIIDNRLCLWLMIKKILEGVLKNLRRAEEHASQHKLAIFAREKFSEPIQFALAEGQLEVDHEDENKIVKCYKVISNNSYLKDYQRQKRAETLPPATATNANNVVVNPFLSSQSSVLMDNEKKDDNVIGDEKQSLKLSKFNVIFVIYFLSSPIFRDMDVCILAHSEILSIYLENFSNGTDSKEFHKFLPSLFPIVQEFLLLTGNGRARYAIASFLRRLQTETLSHS